MVDERKVPQIKIFEGGRTTKQDLEEQINKFLAQDNIEVISLQPAEHDYVTNHPYHGSLMRVYDIVVCYRPRPTQFSE